MKRILILDTETSGTDATTDHIVELGWILYDLEHASIVSMRSDLVSCRGNAAAAVNRIPEALAREADLLVEDAIMEMKFIARDVLAVVAYHAEFDRAFVQVADGGPLLRYTTTPADGEAAKAAAEIPWVCAMNDLEWPKASGGSRSLVALALAHDLGVAHAHRALADCELLARLFSRAHELGADLPAMLQRGLRPKVRVIARVSYAERDKAKAAGFQWDGKVWARSMPAEDAAALPFPTVLVGDAPGAYQAALPLGDKAAP